MGVTSQREEAQNDMMTIEEPQKRRTSRVSGLPPAGRAKQPVPDLTEVHGPLYPVERKHEFPRDPPQKVESKGKDDIQFPVYVAEGGHQYAEVPKSGEKVQNLTVNNFFGEHKYVSIANEILLFIVYILSLFWAVHD